jgi:pectin methylesterase-like acyl-CoA thioesterase
MKIWRAAAIIVGASALAGCQTVPQEQYIWVRTDGQRGAGNPALQQQYQIDRTICFGEVQKSAAGAPVIYYQGLAGAIDAAIIQNQHQQAYLDIMKGCMAQKGYVLVPQSQAAATLQSFRRARKGG